MEEVEKGRRGKGRENKAVGGTTRRPPYMRSLPTPRPRLRSLSRIRSFIAGVGIRQGIADVRPGAVLWRWRQLHHVTHQLVQVHVHEFVHFRAALEIYTRTNTPSPSINGSLCHSRLETDNSLTILTYYY